MTDPAEIPAGEAEIVITLGDEVFHVFFDTAGKVLRINSDESQKGNSAAHFSNEGKWPEDLSAVEQEVNIPNWTCNMYDIRKLAAAYDEIAFLNKCFQSVTTTTAPPPPPVITVPTTVHEVRDAVVQESESPAEWSLGESEEALSTTAPVGLARTLPRTGSNSSSMLSIGGVLLTPGVALAFGSRRYRFGRN